MEELFGGVLARGVDLCLLVSLSLSLCLTLSVYLSVCASLCLSQSLCATQSVCGSGADGQIVKKLNEKTCLYTCTPDWSPIVDHHPEYPQSGVGQVTVIT